MTYTDTLEQQHLACDEFEEYSQYGRDPEPKHEGEDTEDYSNHVDDHYNLPF